jgi:hypothetical protein
MRLRCVIAFAAILGPSLVSAQPAMSFQTASVDTVGVTPGGAVVWFSVARERPVMITHVVHRQGITLAGPDGSSTFPLDERVPSRSVWVVVDLSTGEYTVATPAGFPLRDRSPAGRELNPGIARISLGVGNRPTDRARVVLVRPGVGAWSMTAWDGGDGDADGQTNGAPTLSLTGLAPIGTSPAPPHALLKGDILVAIRPLDLSFFAVRVAAGNSN